MIPFYKLSPGSNVVRFLTTPYQYHCHSGFVAHGRNPDEIRIKCTTLLGNCILCTAGDKPRPRWFVGLVSRKDDQVYLMNLDFGAFTTLREYARHPHWGSPEKYDIDFSVPIYNAGAPQIIPIPNLHLPFDASKYQIDKGFLERICKPSQEDLEILLSEKYREVND